AVTDPIYPVYVDSNVMAGRSGPAGDDGRYAGFVYLPCTAETAFLPALPDHHVDLIYLCYPNNPTGAVMTRDTLARWVEYARRERRTREPQRALAAPAVDEVQRRPLHRAARGGGGLHRRGAAAGGHADRLLHGQRPDHPRGAGGDRSHGLRRTQRALSVGQDA